MPQYANSAAMNETTYPLIESRAQQIPGALVIDGRVRAVRKSRTTEDRREMIDRFDTPDRTADRILVGHVAGARFRPGDLCF